MNITGKRVHIISLTFDSNKIIAPLEHIGYDKIYAFHESKEEFRTSGWRSLSSSESLQNLASGSDLIVIECKSELPYIYEKMQQIIKEESGQGNSIFINASSGSRIFTLASALFSGETNVELYYTHSKSYYVERDFSSGVERIEILPQVALQAQKIEIDSSLTFVLMPFSDNLNAVYEDILVPVLSGLNLRPLRADEIFDNRSIMDDIWDNIKKSRIIISDLTGKKPNVFYETGIAHALGKEVVLITQNLDDVPFDLRHLRCIVYTDNLRGAEKLKSQLTKTIETILSRTLTG
jgi:hypothetical protein